MATPSYFTGDTVRVIGEFRDLEEELVDADGSEVLLKVYNAETRALIDTYTTIRDSEGIYHYDYTFPATEQAFFLEVSGDFGGKSQLKRTKVKTKFKG